MPCDTSIMKCISSPTDGSGQTQSSLQGPEVPTEFFLSRVISPKIRCLLNQSEGRSELLCPLPQYNTNIKEHLTPTESHDPEPCLPLGSPGMWPGWLFLSGNHEEGTEWVSCVCTAFPCSFHSCCWLTTSLWSTCVTCFQVPLLGISFAAVISVIMSSSLFNFTQNLRCRR